MLQFVILAHTKQQAILPSVSSQRITPMKVTTEQLENLLCERSVQSRQVISDIGWTSFQHLSNENLATLDKALRNELLVLATEAQQICDDFFIWQKEMNRTCREKDRSKLIVRSRLRDNSLTIDWIVQNGYSDRKTGKSFCHSTRIVPANKYRLSSSQISKQPAWLKPRILSVDNDLSMIRERIESLGLIRQAVRNYKDIVVRTRNAKQKELAIEALPVPLISPRRDKKA